MSETPIQRVRAHETGVSLIELMVALVIGVFLIVGAISVNQQARNAYRTTEAVSRLQETARYAFDVLEPEVRMANYWGFNSRADYIEERATDGQAEPASLSAFDAQLDYCGDNFAINLDDYVDGSDDTYGLTCAAFGTASGVSDVLVVRRSAENNSSSIVANRVYLQTSRLRGTLFVPAADCADVTDSCDEIPAGYAAPQSRTHQLLVSAYYVSQDSTGRPDSPSLRRKRLAAINLGGAAAVYPDEEIVPGVEDLQVRFGVDTNGDTNIDQYVDPGGVAAGDAVISATIWLRVRAEEPDYTFTDTNTYQYGDMAAPWAPDPDADEDHFRRIVVSKTLQLRNTRR